MPYVSSSAAAPRFRHRVIRLLRRAGLLDEDRTRFLLSWRHSGFPVHTSVTVPAGDGRALAALARYCVPNPVSLARLRFTPAAHTARYLPSDGHRDENVGNPDALDFIARLLAHVPDPITHLVHDDGAYSCVVRGKRKAPSQVRHAEPLASRSAALRWRPRPLPHSPDSLSEPSPRAYVSSFERRWSMKWLRSSLLPVLVVSSFASTAPAAQRSTSESSGNGAVAFLHANVIPMDRERVLRDATVVVSNGKIVAVGPSSSVRIPRNALRVDASGRYLVPALCDMHVHIVDETWKKALPPDLQAPIRDMPYEDFLFPYVATGVTTVQELAATPEEIAMREKIARGEMLGPRLILAPMIDGPKKAWPPPISTWVDNAAEAREAVIRAKAAGYDKIKVYSFLSKESYDAIIATAKEQGIDVVGHVPLSVSVEYVIDSGQKFIAHTEEISKHTDKYDPEHVEYFADLLVKRGIWITPTLVATRSILDFFDDANSIFTKPEGRYFQHPLEVGLWKYLGPNIYAPTPPAMRAKLRDAFVNLQQPLTKSLAAKGGRILAGSDAMMIGLSPGFSLHGELRELVTAGLTPYQALRASTTSPHEYLGDLDKAGTIETGKESDLLLVDANPLDDISAASRIAGVMLRGRWIAREQIAKRMNEIAAAYGAPATR